MLPINAPNANVNNVPPQNQAAESGLCRFKFDLAASKF
jgi:hypothetical protein